MRMVVVMMTFVACGTPGEFVCDVDEDCGDFGLCIDNSCAFGDDACLSGLRFHESAGDRANECVDIFDIPGGAKRADRASRLRPACERASVRVGNAWVAATVVDRDGTGLHAGARVCVGAAVGDGSAAEGGRLQEAPE